MAAGDRVLYFWDRICATQAPGDFQSHANNKARQSAGSAPMSGVKSADFLSRWFARAALCVVCVSGQSIFLGYSMCSGVV